MPAMSRFAVGALLLVAGQPMATGAGQEGLPEVRTALRGGAVDLAETLDAAEDSADAKDDDTTSDDKKDDAKDDGADDDVTQSDDANDDVDSAPDDSAKGDDKKDDDKKDDDKKGDDTTVSDTKADDKKDDEKKDGDDDQEQAPEKQPPVETGTEYGDRVADENPLVNDLDTLKHQKWLAIAVGVLGALAVVGPSCYVRFFLATVGSCVAGLLVGSCYLYLKVPPESHLFLDTVFYLINGDGFHFNKGELHDQHMPAYALWATFFVLGMLRWKFRWECAFYEVVDEVQLRGTIRQPLLNN
mmetsp:Transcript_124180/g.359122  ORF Transcript_124180/g.359122 Transcript_124180/m.359122 type:complete len:300 (+) Transcript_124180:83-982(+)